MARILLHPGFHKTGTSSLQQGLHSRKADLDPHLRALFTHDLLDATRLAKRFSAYRDHDDLCRFAQAFTDAVAAVDPADPRAVLITSEDLSGYIPGNHGVIAYDAAPPLINVATAVLRAHFGQQARLTVLFTTRQPEDWQRSAYWQHLRALRVTEDFETFRQNLIPGSDLGRIVEQVRDRVAGRASVIQAPIESCGDAPLGPLGMALAQLQVPTDTIAPLPAQNVQPDGAADELLTLNRSDLRDADLAEAKRQVVRRYRAAGATMREPGT